MNMTRRSFFKVAAAVAASVALARLPPVVASAIKKPEPRTPDWDEHWDVMSEYARRVAREIAMKHDRRMFEVLLRAARTGAASGL